MNWKGNFSILIGLIAAVLVWQNLPAPGANEIPGLKVSVLDVGQGDAILLTTPNRQHILVDGGPDGTILTRLGEEMKFNEHTIDLMILSHNHADHITGLNRVLERYDVNKIWLSGAIHTTNEYLTVLQNIKKQSMSTEVIWNPKIDQLDGVELSVVHPLSNQIDVRPTDQHDATVVIKVCYITCALLTGDIDESHEQLMLDAGLNLKSDVLKVPHHGSKTGLLPSFLSAINPRFAVISVGEGNTFGHPTATVLNRLREANIATFRTDQNGTVKCILNQTVSCSPARN